MIPVVETIKEEFKGKLEVEEINIEENQAKAQEFSVMSIPTFVILKEGKEVDRKMGAIGESAFREWIAKFLN